MDYRTAPLVDLTKELHELIESRPGRTPHYLPDLAVKMLATQVLQYARAFEFLREGGFVSWSFPIARAAFETAEDLAWLAFAPNRAEYDRRGALAHVGAEMAITDVHRLAEAAKPDTTMTTPEPQEQRISTLAEEWSRFRPDATGIVQAAYEAAKEARKNRRMAWTLLRRGEVHDRLKVELHDPELAGVLRSWYGLLSNRTHPGLHSPQMNRHEAGHEFLMDGDENHELPPASVRFALIVAIHALKHLYSVWETESPAPSDTG